VSQLVAGLCFLVCGGLLVYLHKSKKYTPLEEPTKLEEPEVPADGQ
jgi:hypothetical protein